MKIVFNNIIKVLIVFAILSCNKRVNEQENIFLGIDSLTEGAGNTSYRDYFIKDTVSSKLGYIPINYKSAEDVEISVFMTENMTWVKPELDYSAYPKKFSLDGKGAFTNNGKGDRCIFNISKSHSYKKVGVYYLQQPEGGSFILFTSNKGLSSNKLKVSTKSKNFKIGYAEIETEVADRFNIDSIFGKVALFGISFKNSTIKNDVVNTFAKGGTKLNEILKLDRNFRRQWFKILKPTTYILNAGMNDRKHIKPVIFEQNLKEFIDDLNYGAPKCKIILVEPNESNDYKDTFMPDYRKIRKQISKNNKNIFYYSIPERIGSYEYFVDEEMMIDNVHPNKKGNEIIGNSLYNFLKNIR